MGVLGAPSKLTCVCATLLLAVLILQQPYEVTADKEVDADLIFDNLEESQTNHDRIRKRVPNNKNVDVDSNSSHDDSNWLYKTVHRIKRDLWGWFKDDDTTTTTTTTTHHPDEEQEPDAEEGGQSQALIDEDSKDIYPEVEEDDYEPLTLDNKSDISYGHAGRYSNGDWNDDEDDIYHSGEHSGTGTTTERDWPGDSPPSYFRITFTVLEPFLEDFNNKYSQRYKRFAELIEDNVDRIYSDLPGKQTSRLVTVDKQDDLFSSLVTIDLESRNNNDIEGLKKKIWEHLKSYQAIGALAVKTDDFTFRKFEDGTTFACSANELHCKSGECVPAEARCNGVSECPDDSDEQGCVLPDCAEGELACDISRCIPESHRCDGKRDCDDETDERDCPETQCHSGQFRCDDGHCIENSHRCDGRPDCSRGEDEMNCPERHGTKRCNADEFTCGDGSCISKDRKCDNRVDCSDRSDEKNCPCKTSEFTCANGYCIPSYQRCNKVQNCQDGSDERDCPSKPNLGECETHQKRCNDGTCIDQINFCDGRYDCSDQSDELNCCLIDQFRCSNGSCLPQNKVCDGASDCDHNEDEENCVDCNKQFRCENGDCVDFSSRCDGFSNCDDNSDERGCSGCQWNAFSCHDRKQCIPNNLVCDNVTHCHDKSDEIHEYCKTHKSWNGPGLLAITCAEGEFRCDDNKTCISESFRCDGVNDCPDESDERHCSACSNDEFQCGDNDCIPLNRKCNGVNDCEDRSDEYDCAGTTQRPCSTFEFTCNDGSCIPRRGRCDGTPQCQDYSDERDCGGCQSDEFQCNSGQCIPAYLKCNRHVECTDGSDEHGCPTQPPPGFPEYPPPDECGRGQRPCRTGHQCYPHAAHCDGRVDCNDLSDEDNCHGSSDGLNLRTYPNQQEIKESREVVFQCRDEGPLRVKVHWARGGGLPLPIGTKDVKGRLEMPNIQLNHTGAYICSAIGYPANVPGAQVTVHLEVNPFIIPTARPPIACGLYQSTCSNGDCIDKHLVCDGKFDCSDGSDETRCNAHGCEPNEFRCSNKRCVLKIWRCDSDNDCGDNSDEINCATNPPGSQCEYHQFACRSGNQCIPKSFHCDQSNDCADGSDEHGCSPVTIVRPPPPMAQLQTGETFEITCTAVGVPQPEIVWRLNWGHIPEKCTTTSINELGTLTCPDIQESDQGAYSCEGINIKGSVIATPDTILVVGPRTGVCPKGFFNEEARSPNECISCFCFGVTKECNSADLFTYHLQPPFDSHKSLEVKIDENSGVVDIRNEPSYRDAQPRLTPIPGRNGVRAYLEGQHGNAVPYFAMPENYHGNQLKSYGGYIKYRLNYEGHGVPLTSAPDMILTGNGYTLLHVGQSHQPRREEDISVRFFVGEWIKRSETRPEQLATREEIMMALASVENILIKLQYIDGHVDTAIENIEMDSAAMRNTGLGQATYVEECRCPVGYSGLSCEACAPGYSRHRSGPWLGQCYREPESCSPGYFGDPSRGIACQICPCPLTNPGNQFARTCSLDTDGDVTCDCPPEYTGRRCEHCARGYTGNPLVPGDYCKPSSTCNQEGTHQVAPSGQCHCKLNTDGPSCDTCKKNTFHLSGENQFGCLSCFCMGITDQCSSSSYYRDQITSMFTTSKNDFKLVEANSKQTQIDDGIILNSSTREIIYNNFRRPDIYYWSLPSRFLGDKVTSYGGNLVYSLRYVPAHGGQSSKNNAPDVEITSENHITLTYYARDQPLPNNVQTFTVPLLEQYWHRNDGQNTDREHLMMALAQLKSILIKATYTTNTREAALQSVSMDISVDRNTGQERALAVEQCYCPTGYKGLSCEVCDAGYTRTIDGIYLGRCEKCQCSGYSSVCDPDTGDCLNCRDYTTGQNCELCLPGYEGDPSNRIPCRYVGGESSRCECDPRGSISNDCIGGVCQCKTNVQGNSCDRCREGTFGLNASIAEGCQSCFCSGVATECQMSNLYVEQIPSQIFDQDNHGFILTDQYQRERITTNLQLNVAMNEIGYTFRPSSTDRLFWSLPSAFTGHKIQSYGGKLEFTQRHTQRPDAKYFMDQDVIIIGNGITIYWTNPYEQRPNIANKVSVTLSPSSKWQRLDYRQGPRPASREDILKVLANVNAILIRAQLSTDTASSFISDLTLDTAVEQYTGQPKATSVEVCVCPQGYSGTSCELCSTGYYRDINDIGAGPLGSCSRCPCNENENGCSLGPENRVICNCLPGYIGRACEETNVGIYMGLTPQTAVGTVNTRIPITCYCHAPNVVKIVIIEDGVPVWRRDDVVYKTTYELKRTTHTQVISVPRVIKCFLMDANNYIIGILTGHVYPAAGTSSPPTSAPGTVPQPTITVSISSPELTIKEVGGEVRFNCTARSSNPVRIDWNKADGGLPDNAIDDRRGLLVITNLRISDSGNYICQADDGYSIVSKQVNLAVGSNRPEHPRAQLYPTYLEVNEGEPIELHCSASGYPAPILYWTKANREHLNPRHSVSNGVFTIPNALRSDAGEYECTARNQLSNSTSRAIVQVQDVIGSSIRPIITPPHHTGTSGESFTLTCEAGGPQQDITWSKKGSFLPYNSKDENGILIVNDAKVEDSGIYVCTVTGHSGAVGTANVNVNIIHGNTGVYPTAKVEPTSQRVSQGANVEIHCEALGSPAPTVKWTRIGNQLTTQMYQTGPILRINNIQVTDRGVYVCISSNNLGLAQASAVIEVERREPPEIEIHPQHEQIVTSGSSAQMQCRTIAGIPQPTIRWQRPNEQPLSSHIEQLSNGVLRFSGISPSDGGEYICTAENEAGRVTAIGTIEVQTPPVTSVNPRGEHLSVTVGDFVRLECRATGFPVPTVHWSKYREDVSRFYGIGAHQSATDNVAVYEITVVSQKDEGTYTCLGRNSAGAHESRINLIVDDSIPSRGDITKEDPGSSGDPYYSQPRFKANETPRPNVLDEKTFTVPVGNSADLRCNIQNNPNEPVHTEWIRADNSSLPLYSEIQDGTLIINNAQLSDAGEYQCLGISTRTGDILFIVPARVQVLSPPRITLKPARQVVRPGDDAVIECTATGEQPIKISWNGLNRTLPHSVYVRDGYIRFQGIQLSDAGRYRCTAINSVGEADSVAEVLVQENIQQPPITARDREQSTEAGSTVTLACSIRSDYGNSEVVWYKENDNLPKNSASQDKQLIIYNIQPHDAGKYYCEITGEDGSTSDYINLYVTSPPSRPQPYPTLDVQASSQNVHIGDNLDLHCRSSESGVITTWVKLSGIIATNVQINGGNLRINNVRLENNGAYRCEARGYYGFYHKDHLVDIIDNVKEEEEIAIKSAPQGSTVILDCKTDLDEPVNFMWSKQRGNLPRDVDIHARSIQLNDVSGNDAGTYVCTSSNPYKTIETPTILLITGIVPYFTQAPSSYIGLAPLPDSYLQYSIEISFKPQVHDGLILYNGNKGNVKTGDFMSLALSNGIPEYRFSLGHNSVSTLIQGDRPLTIGQWHTIKISRMRRKGSMYIDGEKPIHGIANSKYSGLTLGEPLYLGGVPNFNDISPLVETKRGMVGCISRLKIGNAFIDILKEAQMKKGITSCETCSDSPCQNKGVCQEALSKEGFMCICPAGYSGATCSKVGGETCSAHTCGTGRCVDTEDSYKCNCPLGRIGRHCEREVEIIEPAFSKNAYVAYPTPNQLKRLKISMKIKPKDLSDGVIAYCAETEDGDGDFLSLAVKDKHLEFRFDIGSGPIVIRSANELRPDHWVVVTANRMVTEGRLIVNGDVPVIGKTAGNHRSLNLHTQFFIGGFDKERVKLNEGVGVKTGFHGCIAEVTISSLNIHLLQSVEDAANVQDCSTLDNDDNIMDNDISDVGYSHGTTHFDTRPTTGCHSNPCRNDGQCQPLSPDDYKCTCVNGYSGNDCEIAPYLCDQLRPCQNRGKCHGNTTQYVCDCPMGFTGINCETTNTLRNDVHFSGNGFLEFNRNLLNHDEDEKDEIIALELSTNSSNGLIFWHGQREDEDGDRQDFIALAVINGYLEYSYDLGSGPAIIHNDKVKVNDGLHHRVILKRHGRDGSIEVDGDYTVEGSASGITNQMNCNGNIFLGGTPNITLMTGGRYISGFNGCIHGFELQDSRALDLGVKALSGLNVKACYRSDESNSIVGDGDDEEEVIN